MTRNMLGGGEREASTPPQISMLNENPLSEHIEAGCELQLESSGTIRCNSIATHNDAKLWQKQKTSFEQKGKLYRFVENVFGMMQFYAARSFLASFSSFSIPRHQVENEKKAIESSMKLSKWKLRAEKFIEFIAMMKSFSSLGYLSSPDDKSTFESDRTRWNSKTAISRRK